MALTTAGINVIAQSIIGQSTVFNSANARIGVGDGTTAFNASQTDLQGTDKLRKAMDAGFPTIDGPVVTFKSTFLPAEANFAWNEWGIFNAGSGGTMLNRLVESNGTKQSNQTWVLEVKIAFAIGN